MPKPSDRELRIRVDAALAGIAKETLRLARLRAKAGRPFDGIRVQVSPTAGQYSRGVSKSRCGLDRADPLSIEAYDLAADEFADKCGVSVVRSRSGVVEAVKTGAAGAALACDILGEEIPRPPRTPRLEECARLGGWAGSWASSMLAAPSAAALADAECLAPAIEAYASMEKPLWPRVLSCAAYGDSKRFEREMASKFIAAAAAAGACSADGGEADWEELGFRVKPSFARLRGSCRISLGGGIIDLSLFGPDGAQIPKSAIKEIDAFEGLRCAVVVENLTNFVEACDNLPDGVLAIYGGGQVNSATAELLRALGRTAPAAPVHVWSDIDLGGFRIATRIMELNGNARPFLMGPNELDAHLDSLKSPDNPEAYLSELEAWIESNGESPLAPSAMRCLEIGRTLEQECQLDGEAQRAIRRLAQCPDGRNDANRKA